MINVQEALVLPDVHFSSLQQDNPFGLSVHSALSLPLTPEVQGVL